MYLLNMTWANIAFTFGIPLWWIEIIMNDGIRVKIFIHFIFNSHAVGVRY